MTPPLVTRRRLVATSLVCSLLVAGGLVAPTFAARQAVLDADRVTIAEVTVAIEKRNGDPGFAARFTVRNPTPHGLTLVYGQLTAVSGGERLTRLTTTPFDRRAVVPAGGAVAVETFLPIIDDRLGAARAALDGDAVSIRGQMRATVVREPIDVEVAAPARER